MAAQLTRLPGPSLLLLPARGRRPLRAPCSLHTGSSSHTERHLYQQTGPPWAEGLLPAASGARAWGCGENGRRHGLQANPPPVSRLQFTGPPGCAQRLAPGTLPAAGPLIQGPVPKLLPAPLLTPSLLQKKTPCSFHFAQKCISVTSQSTDIYPGPRW